MIGVKAAGSSSGIFGKKKKCDMKIAGENTCDFLRTHVKFALFYIYTQKLCAGLGFVL